MANVPPRRRQSSMNGAGVTGSPDRIAVISAAHRSASRVGSSSRASRYLPGPWWRDRRKRSVALAGSSVGELAGSSIAETAPLVVALARESAADRAEYVTLWRDLEEVEAGQRARDRQGLWRRPVEEETTPQFVAVRSELVVSVQRPHLLVSVVQPPGVEEGARRRDAVHLAQRGYRDGETDEVARNHHGRIVDGVLIRLGQCLKQ